MKQRKWAAFLGFALLMAGLGANDALRGIFAPVFQERYGLNGSQLSLIVTISYVGNLLFLSAGGKLLDLFPRKRVAMAVTAVWAAAIVMNLLSDGYTWILVSMFFALGASTLLNTTVNILTPAVFAGYSGLMVNLFFFIQGIGTSMSQLLLGRYAFHYGGWKWINAVLLIIAGLVILLFFFLKVPEQEKEKESQTESEKKEPDRVVLWIFTAMMGCYFIGEHGIMNWLLSYCISAFSMEAGEASLSLSLFWGGMTAGRLLFAPAVQKMGTVKSMKLFGGIGTAMFCIGCAVGEKGVLILGASGFALAVLYPTMVLLIQQIYPARTAATRTGMIISTATVADIAFNMLFGAASSAWGYRASFMILPAAMAVFYSLYIKLTEMLKESER